MFPYRGVDVLEHRLHGRGDLGELVAQLAAWDRAGAYVAGLHAGDVGWALRQPDELLGAVHGWWDRERLAAAMLVDGDWGARPRIAPDRRLDRTVASAVIQAVEALPAAQLWSDAAPGTMLRHQLLVRGWEPDPDPWVALHRELQEPVEPAPELVVRQAGDCVLERVTVQRAGFAGSTFDEASWHRMAAGPGYRLELDLVGFSSGEPAAIATAWSSVPGGTAVLEPVAVDSQLRGRGLGRAIVMAAAAACGAAGASGVSVCTPASNQVAVAAYVSAGFRRVETLEGLTLRRRVDPGS